MSGYKVSLVHVSVARLSRQQKLQVDEVIREAEWSLKRPKHAKKWPTPLVWNTNTRITHGSVAGMNDWAVEEDGATELGRHVRLGVGKLRVAWRLRHEELTLVVVNNERFWKSISMSY